MDEEVEVVVVLLVVVAGALVEDAAGLELAEEEGLRDPLRRAPERLFFFTSPAVVEEVDIVAVVVGRCFDVDLV